MMMERSVWPPISRVLTTKFPGLYRIWNTDEGFKWFVKHKNIAIWDDDAPVDSGSVEDLFTIMDVHPMLKAIQPSMHPLGKNSYDISVLDPSNRNGMRFTSFVEMGFPVVSTEGVMEFLAVYNDELEDWGCDVVMSALFNIYPLSMAVIDAVTFYNPWPDDKGESAPKALLTEENWLDWSEKYDFQSPFPGEEGWPVFVKYKRECATCEWMTTLDLK